MSFAAWIPLTLLSFYWRPLWAAAVPLALAIGCLANWAKNRTFHCSITSPLFLAAAAVILLSEIHVIRADRNLVWGFLIGGIVVAFVLERRYATRTQQ